jgi:hypothetical protein
MTTILGAALEVQRYLSRVGERFCLIGGIALQRWGEPRLTRDVDVTVLSPFGEEGPSADRLLAAFRPRIENAREFAMRNRVLLIESEGGVAVDVAFGAVPFEVRCVARSSEWRLAPDAVLRTCTAEDLIVLKAFASRPQDWIDVESIAIRQQQKLDWKLVFEELEPLAAVRDVPGLLDRLRQLRNNISPQE